MKGGWGEYRYHGQERRCGGQNGPQRHHALIPRICRWVKLHGKKDFQPLIKVTDLKI